MEMLAWDALSSLSPGLGRRRGPAALAEAPTAFAHPAAYVDFFKELLMEEMHAHLVQASLAWPTQLLPALAGRLRRWHQQCSSCDARVSSLRP